MQAGGAGGDQRQGVRVELVLDRKDAVSKSVGGIAIHHRDGALGDDGAGIHLGHHEMDRAAGEPDAVGQRPGVGMEPW